MCEAEKGGPEVDKATADQDKKGSPAVVKIIQLKPFYELLEPSKPDSTTPEPVRFVPSKPDTNEERGDVEGRRRRSGSRGPVKCRTRDGSQPRGAFF